MLNEDKPGSRKVKIYVNCVHEPKFGEQWLEEKGGSGAWFKGSGKWSHMGKQT
jgi:hypothetical protein